MITMALALFCILLYAVVLCGTGIAYLKIKGYLKDTEPDEEEEEEEEDTEL